VVALTAGGISASVLTITSERTGPTGSFTLTVGATDGVRKHNQNVTLNILR